MRKYYDIILISIIAALLVAFWCGNNKQTVDTKVIKIEMDINEIDRALTEIEGGLDRIIDKLSGEVND